MLIVRYEFQEVLVEPQSEMVYTLEAHIHIGIRWPSQTVVLKRVGHAAQAPVEDGGGQLFVQIAGGEVTTGFGQFVVLGITMVLVGVHCAQPSTGL